MDRNVKLTGDSTSLVSALGEATKAMDAFTASAKNLQAGTKQLTSLSNIRPATLKGLGDSLKNIAEGGKALEKVKLEKVTNAITTLKGLKLSPKLAETITANANSFFRFGNSLETLQGISVTQITSNIKQLEQLKLDPNFPDKLKETNAALRTLSSSAKGLQNLDIDKFASNIELFGAVRVDKDFATDIAKTATGLKDLSLAAKRLEGVNIAQVNKGLNELAARKVDPKIAGTLLQFAKGLQSVARASKTIQDIDLSKIADNVKSIGQGGSGDGVNQLISRLQKIEPILSKLSTDAKTLADNLNKIGVTKISQLSKNFEATSVSAKKLISDLNTGKKTFDDLSQAEKKVVADFQGIVAANKESLKSLTKTKNVTEDVNTQVRKLITQLNNGEVSYEKMSKESQQLITNVKRTAAANKLWLAQLNQVKKETNDINITWESIARYWVTGTVIGQARQFTQQLRESVLAAAELSVKLAEIQTIAGGQVSEQDLATQVRELSDTFTGDAADQAEAFYQAISNGVVDAANAQQFLITSNKLALATVTDVGNATNLLASIINSYSLATTEATRVSDTFFKAVELGRFRLGEIANTIGRTTVLAAEIGVKYQEVAASLAFLTKQGTTAANAQTLIRQVLLKLIKPTEETKNILNELGFESGEALVRARGLQGALESLFNATSGGSTEIAKLFNNVRGLQGALAFSGEGAAQYAEIFDKITDSQNAASDAADKVSNSLGKRLLVSIEQVQNSLTQDLGGAILESLADADGTFDSLTESITTLVRGITPLVVGLTSIIKTFKPLIVGLGAVATAYATARAANVALTLTQRALNVSILSSVAAQNKWIAKLVASSTAAKVAGAVSTAYAAIMRGVSAALQFVGFSATAASAGVAKLTLAIRGLLASTGIGVILVGIGLALEGLINYFADGTENSDAFADSQKRLQDALEETTNKLNETSAANDKLLQGLQGSTSRIVSVFLKDFVNNGLGKAIDSYEELIKKQDGFETIFGNSIDKLANKTKSEVQTLTETIKEIDALLGKGTQDEALLQGLEKQQETLSIQSEGLFNPFDKIDNIKKQFDLVAQAISRVTSVKSVEKLTNNLKKLADAEKSAGVGAPDDIIAQRLSRQREINKLSEDNLKRVREIAVVRQKELTPVAQSLSVFKATNDVLKDNIISIEDFTKEAQSLRLNDKGQLDIKEGSKIDETLEAFEKLKKNFEDQIKASPEFRKQLEKQLAVIEKQEAAFEKSLKNIEKEIVLLDRSRKAQESINQLREDQAKLTKQTAEENTKLVNLQTNLNKLTAANTAGLDKASDIFGDEGLELGGLSAFRDIVKQLPNFRDFGTVSQGFEFSLDSKTQGAFQNAITKAFDQIRRVGALAESGAKTGDLTQFEKTALNQLSTDSFALIAGLEKAVKIEFDKIKKGVEEGTISVSEERERLNNLQKAVSSLGLGDLTKEGGFSNIRNLVGDLELTGENVVTLFKNQLASQKTNSEQLDKVNKKLEAETQAIDKKTKLINKEVELIKSREEAEGKLLGITGRLVKEFENLEGILKRLPKIDIQENKTGVNNGKIGNYSGGRIYGTAGIDRVPAMLTAGEFVMPKDSTNKYLPLLESMRRGSYVPPQYYAQGGLVSQSGPQALDQSVSVGDINVTVQSSGSVNAREIAQAINAEIRQGAIRMRR